MKKSTIILAVVAVLVIGVSFYAGMKYAQGKQSATQLAFRNGLPGAGAAGQIRRNGTGLNAGGLVNGEVLSKDDKSVTVKLRDGGSKIVFYTDKTEVSKSVSGTATDVIIGENVMITGTSNPDGSVSATNIQIRPAMPVAPAPAQK